MLCCRLRGLKLSTQWEGEILLSTDCQRLAISFPAYKHGARVTRENRFDVPAHLRNDPHHPLPRRTREPKPAVEEIRTGDGESRRLQTCVRESLDNGDTGLDGFTHPVDEWLRVIRPEVSVGSVKALHLLPQDRFEVEFDSQVAESGEVAWTSAIDEVLEAGRIALHLRLEVIELVMELAALTSNLLVRAEQRGSWIVVISWDGDGNWFLEDELVDHEAKLLGKGEEARRRRLE